MFDLRSQIPLRDVQGRVHRAEGVQRPSVLRAVPVQRQGGGEQRGRGRRPHAVGAGGGLGLGGEPPRNPLHITSQVWWPPTRQRAPITSWTNSHELPRQGDVYRSLKFFFEQTSCD